uniref:Receptor expression-enhancing protein n=1 Tax=Heterorhabditis bacteriophora TaxID=37862 RepID=A0A1I7XAZ2_HETBA
MSAVLSRFVTLTAGTLYPAYRSYKAVRTKDVREYVKWMMYWIVFAIYCFVETLADVFIAFWFPFYYQLKIVFVFWLLSPWTKGASILYRKWIHPTLAKHEKDIDALLDQAKSESYNQKYNLTDRLFVWGVVVYYVLGILLLKRLSEDKLNLLINYKGTSEYLAF